MKSDKHAEIRSKLRTNRRIVIYFGTEDCHTVWQVATTATS